MKKFFLVTLLTLFTLIILIVGGLLFVLYVRPDLVVNTKNLDTLLKRTEILKKWSWDKGQLNLSHKKWNHFNFNLEFSNFCFTYEHEALDASSCLEELKGNIDIIYDLKDGLKVINNDPVLLHSSLTKILLKETKKEDEQESSPPDIYGIWTMLWGPLIPELDLRFLKIEITQKGKTYPFDLSLLKMKNEIHINALDFRLMANARGFEVFGPKSYKLPVQQNNLPPLHINNFHLSARIDPKSIGLETSGYFESAPFKINSKVPLPIIDDFSSPQFLRKVALETNGEIKIEDVKKALKTHGKAPYNELPAPLNAMNGNINFEFSAIKGSTLEEIIIFGKLNTNLGSHDQALVINLNLSTPLDLKTFKPGTIGVEVNLEKVILQLPKISKTSLPPQFMPDSRFRKQEAPKKTAEKKTPLSLKLDAVGEHALNLKTNLLDETLRLNFNFDLSQDGLETGHIKILPLKTTIFKRLIHVSDLVIAFKKNIDPVINSHIEFILPEYTIYLELEGPMSKPKYAFQSKPPLPQNDIYAVLLFGRPMADLDPDTQGAAGRTNKILSQGILSLSVLYFLAGSPVEYIGYDPDSKEAQAQIGLNSKTSLRVGTKGAGQNSTGIRRSLGKGWYIDTSVQSSSGSSSGNDYGVLLERIIAY